jgi:LDH2 family malate/lactate/ureidoglycolate dehydrogenase
MATSAVAAGKIATALREGREIPEGWTSSAHGPPRLNPFGNLSAGVAMLPLGGEGDETGGHKGYGISLMVELFCSLLSGSELEDRMASAAGESPAATGHFMGALKVAGFREPARVFDHMARTFEIIRASEKASGHERIYIHGEPEAFAEEENRRLGIPITPPVLDQLRRLNEQHALGFEL